MLSIIAAIDQKRGLGKNNQLLFKIKKDLQRFKKITLNHPVVMGRKTFQSIGRPLPKRINIVVTRNKSFRPKRVKIFNSLNKAVEFAKQKSEEVFIGGGGSIYRQTISLADKLYLTIVEGDFKADTFFPEYQGEFSRKVFEEKHQSEGYQYKFVEYVR